LEASLPQGTGVGRGTFWPTAFVVEAQLTHSRLTEQALATIASILDLPRGTRPPEEPTIPSPPIAPIRAEGYTKFGPGPMAAIRFKWSVRRDDNGDYFVDETIGEHPASVVIGPMSAEAAMQFVDARESEARARFEQIRSEMLSRSAVEVAQGDDKV
jgi:hypothetical protein